MLRAPDSRCPCVADAGVMRASADQPGGWIVLETFRLEPCEPHGAGHLLKHTGTGRYVTVGADGAKVADGDPERGHPPPYSTHVTVDGERSPRARW
jgi:beta-glucosidase